MKTLTFILGGARSGKSAFGQALAAKASSVLFVATAEARDQDMASRIAAHRRDRPAAWHTLEEPFNLARRIPPAARDKDMVLLDCLTLWVNNLLLAEPAPHSEAINRQAEVLLETYRTGAGSWTVVSNEVGLGIVPATTLGRRYQDELGKVNQVFAAAADQVYLLVAGMAMDMTALGAKPWPALLDQAHGSRSLPPAGTPL